jgi:hypothetical protein
VKDASPLWTLQRLCFEPDVAADFSDRGENRDLGTATEAIKIQLTREMRLENGSPLAAPLHKTRLNPLPVLASWTWCS